MSLSCIAIVENLGVEQSLVERQIHQAFAEKPLHILWKSTNELSEEEKSKVDALVSVKTPLNEEILKNFPELRVIAVAFTGYGTVALDYCKSKNIQVFNVPAYSTDSVAELVIGLTISLLRDIPTGDSLVRSGGWNLSPGSDLSGKVVGIVGTGAIGIRTAELFKAFRCQIIGWSRSKRNDFTALGGLYVDKLEDVGRNSFKVHYFYSLLINF